MDLNSLRIVPTAHFIQVVKKKGFDPDKIIDTLTNPAEVYESRNHPGQWRVTGNGLCLVGAPQRGTFRLITAYLDRVITDLRPDQIAAGAKINRSA